MYVEVIESQLERGWAVWPLRGRPRARRLRPHLRGAEPSQACLDPVGPACVCWASDTSTPPSLAQQMAGECLLRVLQPPGHWNSHGRHDKEPFALGELRF